MADNDDQAQKLIESLSGKMVEAILPKITESVEAQIQGIAAKNDELLDKLAKSKQDDARMNQLDALLKSADVQQRERLDKDGNMLFQTEGKNIRISKADALSPTKYREAKKLAQERGVDLEISRD